MRTLVTLELPVRSAPTTSTSTAMPSPPSAAPATPTPSAPSPDNVTGLAGPTASLRREPPWPFPPGVSATPEMWGDAPVTGNQEGQRVWCKGCHLMNCAGCMVVDGEPTPISTCQWCGESGPGFDENDPPSDYCGHDPAMIASNVATKACVNAGREAANKRIAAGIKPFAWTLFEVLKRIPSYAPTCLNCIGEGLFAKRSTMVADPDERGKYRCACCGRVDDYSEDLELVEALGPEMNPDRQVLSVPQSTDRIAPAPVVRLQVYEQHDTVRAELAVWEAGDDLEEDPPRYAQWGTLAQVAPALKRFGLDARAVKERIGAALREAGVPLHTVFNAMGALA